MTTAHNNHKLSIIGRVQYILFPIMNNPSSARIEETLIDYLGKRSSQIHHNLKLKIEATDYSLEKSESKVEAGRWEAIMIFLFVSIHDKGRPHLLFLNTLFICAF